MNRVLVMGLTVIVCQSGCLRCAFAPRFQPRPVPTQPAPPPPTYVPPVEAAEEPRAQIIIRETEPDGPMPPIHDPPAVEALPAPPPAHAKAEVKRGGRFAWGTVLLWGAAAAAAALGFGVPAAVGLAGWKVWAARAAAKAGAAAVGKVTADATRKGGGADAMSAPPRGAPARTVEELVELLRLRRLEGRDPLLDAAFGMFAQDELEAALEKVKGDAGLTKVFEELQRNIRQRVDAAAPLAVQQGDV